MKGVVGAAENGNNIQGSGGGRTPIFLSSYHIIFPSFVFFPLEIFSFLWKSMQISG
jgi:hypothetical protein